MPEGSDEENLRQSLRQLAQAASLVDPAAVIMDDSESISERMERLGSAIKASAELLPGCSPSASLHLIADEGMLNSLTATWHWVVAIASRDGFLDQDLNVTRLAKLFESITLLFAGLLKAWVDSFPTDVQVVQVKDLQPPIRCPGNAES